MNNSLSIIIFLLAGIALILSCNRPLAHFQLENDHQAEIPNVIKFYNTSKNAEKYLWDFGDGTKSELVEPTHQYLHSGHYDVKLTVSNGKKSSDYKKHIHVLAPKTCHVLIKTNFGNMVVELYDNTPLHRDNFIHRVEQGFYQDLLFHRVIEGFVVQGGDQESRNAPLTQKIGSGISGNEINAEFNPENIHLKGALGAARMGDQINPEKKSDSSQFYIVHGSKVLPETLDHIEHSRNFRYSSAQKNAYETWGGTPQLDMEYTVFGKVVSGLEVLDAIAASKTNGEDRPLENVWMKLSVIN